MTSSATRAPAKLLTLTCLLRLRQLSARRRSCPLAQCQSLSHGDRDDNSSTSGREKGKKGVAEVSRRPLCLEKLGGVERQNPKSWRASEFLTRLPSSRAFSFTCRRLRAPISQAPPATSNASAFCRCLSRTPLYRFPRKMSDYGGDDDGGLDK